MIWLVFAKSINVSTLAFFSRSKSFANISICGFNGKTLANETFWCWLFDRRKSKKKSDIFPSWGVSEKIFLFHLSICLIAKGAIASRGVR